MSPSLLQRIFALIIIIVLVIIVGFLFITLLPIVLVILTIVFAIQFFKPRGYMRDQNAHQQYQKNAPSLPKKPPATDAVFTKKN